MSDESYDKNLGNGSKITRRDFIKFLGAADAAVTLLSLVPLGGLLVVTQLVLVVTRTLRQT